MNAAKIIEKAKRSRFYLWLLNRLLARMIPFNLPHGFEITELSATHLSSRLPYKRLNRNHVRGLHACALATLSEFTTGFLLISRLGMNNYRLILKRLEVDYLYQGKMDAVARFEVSDNWIKESILAPLSKEGVVVVPCEVKIYDAAGNHLTTAVAHWQLKEWSKVKTKT